MAKIKKTMTLGEILRKYPETYEVFQKYGLRCIGCIMISFETLEQAAKAHGIDLKKLLKELNEVIEKKKSK